MYLCLNIDNKCSTFCFNQLKNEDVLQANYNERQTFGGRADKAI